MATTYPLHLDADLDPKLSRWLWLVKWVLAIPHYFVLFFLWVAFAVLSVVAFFAILFTGHYPRSIFEFNVGVLRWSWRVSYYTYGALATDRYPPFTLNEVPDYPAHLSVDYPEHLSRGLVLVKWWLLAIPHYLVIAFFVGGGVYAGEQMSGEEGSVLWSGGLIGLLVFVAAVVLLFTGSYPRSLYDFVLGMNRWVLRVAAYAGLMTDQYPPFRFDQGGHEPDSGHLAVQAPPPPPPTTMPATQSPAPTATETAFPPPAAPPAPPATRGPSDGPGAMAAPAPPAPMTGPATTPTRWGPGRVLALIFGVLITLMSMGAGAAGVTLLVADQGLRDADGFLMSGQESVATSTYAIVSEDIELHLDDPAGFLPQRIIGDGKVTADAGAGQSVFVGIASTPDVRAYLDGVAYDRLVDLAPGREPEYRTAQGGAPSTPPTEAGFWATQSSGTGLQSIQWPVQEGSWTVVMMRPDGAQGVAADVAAGVTAPALTTAAVVLLVMAVLGLLVAAGLLVLAVHRPRRTAP